MSHPVRQLRYRVQRRSSKRVTVKIVALAKEAPCDSGPLLQTRLGGGQERLASYSPSSYPFLFLSAGLGTPGNPLSEGIYPTPPYPHAIFLVSIDKNSIGCYLHVHLLYCLVQATIFMFNVYTVWYRLLSSCSQPVLFGIGHSCSCSTPILFSIAILVHVQHLYCRGWYRYSCSCSPPILF